MQVERKIIDELRDIELFDLVDSIVSQLMPLHQIMLPISHPENSWLHEIIELTHEINPQRYSDLSITKIFGNINEVERRIIIINSLTDKFINEMRENSYALPDGPQRTTYAVDCWYIIEDWNICREILFSKSDQFDLKHNQWHESVIKLGKTLHAKFDQLARNLKVAHVGNLFEEYYPNTRTTDRDLNESRDAPYLPADYDSKTATNYNFSTHTKKPVYKSFTDLFIRPENIESSVDALRKVDPPLINDKGEWIGRRGSKAKFAAFIRRLEDCNKIHFVSDKKLLVVLAKNYFPGLDLGKYARTMADPDHNALNEFSALILP